MTTRATLGTFLLLTAVGPLGCFEDAWAQYPPDARPPSEPGRPRPADPGTGSDLGPGGLGSAGLHTNSSPPATTAPYRLGERPTGVAVPIAPPRPSTLHSPRFEDATGATPAQTPRIRVALARVAQRVFGCLSAAHFTSTLNVGVHFNLNAAPHAAAVVVDTGHPIAQRCIAAGVAAEALPTATPPVPVTTRFRVDYGPR